MRWPYPAYPCASWPANLKMKANVEESMYLYGYVENICIVKDLQLVFYFEAVDMGYCNSKPANMLSGDDACLERPLALVPWVACVGSTDELQQTIQQPSSRSPSGVLTQDGRPR
ncbi:hypothetical protein PR001_g33979 [Phytophthora rubi]|uniref:Uncharacterized protein n=1 Tax=Phytophthora rubi TaxID=129364 RepID=A0A6A3FXH3_9STRA|nr:hypothetical protein PR001_g33979 [Phytophthora rubi]